MTTREDVDKWLKEAPSSILIEGVEIRHRIVPIQDDSILAPRVENAGYGITIHIVCRKWEDD